MEKKIAVIAGDGIGPEIVAQAKKVLDRISSKYGHTFHYTDVLMGGCSIDACGVPLTDETIQICKESDAVLMGSIGGDAATSPWYRLSPELRPEAGLLKLRKSLNLYCNLRPAYLFKELSASCPLASKDGGRNFDLVICRELTGGLYFGDRYTKEVDGLVMCWIPPDSGERSSRKWRRSILRSNFPTCSSTTARCSWSRSPSSST